MRMFGIADVNWGQGNALQTSPGVSSPRTATYCLQWPGKCHCMPDTAYKESGS